MECLQFVAIIARQVGVRSSRRCVMALTGFVQSTRRIQSALFATDSHSSSSSSSLSLVYCCANPH